MTSVEKKLENSQILRTRTRRSFESSLTVITVAT